MENKSGSVFSDSPLFSSGFTSSTPKKKKICTERVVPSSVHQVVAFSVVM